MVVREGVDVEGETQRGWRGGQDGGAEGDAGVVDEDGGVAVGGADGGSDGGDGGGGGDVAGVVVHV